MKPDDLRAAQAPLKARYKDDARSARLTLRARGDLAGDGIGCKVETGRGLVDAGLHPYSGGSGAQACSGDMLLEALAACAGVTLRAVATALGIEVRSGTVTVEGDLDFRGTLGVAKEAPVGFEAVRVRFEVDSDAAPEQLEKLLQLSERYCVVLQTLRTPARTSSQIVRAGDARRDA